VPIRRKNPPFSTSQRTACLIQLKFRSLSNIVVDLQTLLAAHREVQGYRNAKSSSKQRCVHRESMTQRLSVEYTLYLKSIVNPYRHKCVGCGRDGSRSCLVSQCARRFWWYTMKMQDILRSLRRTTEISHYKHVPTGFHWRSVHSTKHSASL
jgi:hypothetical protein